MSEPQPIAPGTSHDLEAVVIGASAGAIEALTVVLGPLPATGRLPIFIVVHVPGQQPSQLVQVFRRKCQVQLKEAEDKEPIVPGQVYFAPADYHMLIEQDRSLSLSLDPVVNFSRPSIDVLFESAADAYGPGLLGIVLTGASSDGAAGLKAITAAGGAALCENPATARAPIMPRAALSACPGATALALPAIAARLRALASERHRP